MKTRTQDSQSILAATLVTSGDMEPVSDTPPRCLTWMARILLPFLNFHLEVAVLVLGWFGTVEERMSSVENRFALGRGSPGSEFACLVAGLPRPEGLPLTKMIYMSARRWGRDLDFS